MEYRYIFGEYCFNRTAGIFRGQLDDIGRAPYTVVYNVNTNAHGDLYVINLNTPVNHAVGRNSFHVILQDKNQMV